ncbi:hypothetical protein [Paraburkholderia acidisoli]|uniref:Uncharacterized protein n=1 Tax=Paraburkholderia acidisoli TaxID=2571748 RepID=A0A7Z2JD84_9BURK|nr:hypothetical protein [Paraburkholderia acidisoli]QGZ60892.1 hypothetical protein FAZ98_03600 [Paraburkholderia acidisoli]
MRKAFVNAAASILLFLALVYPVGRLIFIEPVATAVARAAFWVGLDRDGEPGDALVDSVLLVSLLLALAMVALANALLKRHRRKPLHVQ